MGLNSYTKLSAGYLAGRTSADRDLSKFQRMQLRRLNRKRNRKAPMRPVSSEDPPHV